MSTPSKSVPAVDPATVKAYEDAARGFGGNCAAATPEKTPTPKTPTGWQNVPAWEGFHNC